MPAGSVRSAPVKVVELLKKNLVAIRTLPTAVPLANRPLIPAERAPDASPASRLFLRRIVSCGTEKSVIKSVLVVPNSPNAKKSKPASPVRTSMPRPPAIVSLPSLPVRLLTKLLPAIVSGYFYKNSPSSCLKLQFPITYLKE